MSYSIDLVLCFYKIPAKVFFAWILIVSGSSVNLTSSFLLEITAQLIMMYFLTTSFGLREYAAPYISEAYIVDTVKYTGGEDLVPYETLLSKYRDVFITFRMKNLTKLYHFLYIVLAYFQHFQLLLDQEVEISKAKLMMLSQQFDYTLKRLNGYENFCLP
ncbi:hypothetical protein RhiirA4_477376 [Rhizophagus irregularis]|uniref:Uncharacterized protein n=1 Tax=Rhizophagus irregularis TaxID=588596 RepID=A0A2I1HD53_9GLOM|nr:hypothetical protein RhiirA4_477376 [Rhizophagus irregularis]